MTDTAPDTTEMEPIDDPKPTDDPIPADRRLPDGSSVRRTLAWAALVVCSLLALYALIQFYASSSAAIELWVEPRYEPLVQAAFNLVVLLCALVGVSLVVRELS